MTTLFTYFHKGLSCLVFILPLFLLLNAPFLGEKIQFYLGKSFIDRRLPGKLKKALPLTLFMFTIVHICYIYTLSLYIRILYYNSISDSINQSLNSASDKTLGNRVFERFTGHRKYHF